MKRSLFLFKATTLFLCIAIFAFCLLRYGHVADNSFTLVSAIPAPPSVVRWWGNLIIYNDKRCVMMTIDELASKMERINVLAELLLDLLIGNPQAQIITEVIIETSVLPEA